MKSRPRSRSSSSSASSSSSGSSSSSSSSSSSGSSSGWEHSRRMKGHKHGRHHSPHHHKRGPHHKGGHHHHPPHHRHIVGHHHMMKGHHGRRMKYFTFQKYLESLGTPLPRMSHHNAPRTERNVPQEGQEQIENVENEMGTLRIDENSGVAHREIERFCKKIEKKHGKHMKKMSRMEQEYLSGKSCLENQIQFKEDLLYRKLEKKAKKIEKKIIRLEEKRQKQVLLMSIISAGFSFGQTSTPAPGNEPHAEPGPSMENVLPQQPTSPMEATVSA